MKSSKEIGGYILRETIGYGSSGKVKYAVHKETKKKVAVKIVQKGNTTDKILTRAALREVEILKLINHPHTIELYDVLEDREHLYLVMEHIVNGELYDYISKTGPLIESEARCFFQQMVSAVDYLHSHGVIHRDLKPENILLGENLDIKIADFGLASFIKDGELFSSYVGSLLYSAPEVLEGRQYDPKVDVWSLGVNLFVMLSGQLPYGRLDGINSLLSSFKETELELPDGLSQGATDVLKKTLRVNPTERIQIRELFEHPWFIEKFPKHLLKFSEGNNNYTKSLTSKREQITLDDTSVLTGDFVEEYHTPTPEHSPRVFPDDKVQWRIGIGRSLSHGELLGNFYATLRQLDIYWRICHVDEVNCRREESRPLESFSYHKTFYRERISVKSENALDGNRWNRSETPSTNFKVNIYSDESTSVTVIDLVYNDGDILFFLKTCGDIRHSLENCSESSNVIFDID